MSNLTEIRNKLNSMTAGEIWEMVWKIHTTDATSDAAELVYEEALNVLEKKVDDDRYLELMQKLESTMN